MIPESVSETVTNVPVPNYREDSDISVLFFAAMKRFHEEVDFKPVLRPVNHEDTIVCFKDCTKKRYVSKTFYEPRVKPKVFSESMVIYPKRPERTFVTLLDYHIEECRKWFKTTLEFKARTYTSSKIMKDSGYGSDLDSSSDEDTETKETDTGPGASSVYIPRFDKWQSEIEDFGDLEKQILVNGYHDYEC
ncbi:refilin-B-like [Saccostrea echinata]|uniref:refilin-B-like n=1 Tax=Saccostrea echinata TaxID=191078 RepID=UPI002A809B05|nr:refilin-B-like [Saccostrea echinata]